MAKASARHILVKTEKLANKIKKEISIGNITPIQKITAIFSKV
jgi:parvulin-like peptidyl-prolyl isomerase